jgi:predicted Rossmann fold nucleotide-binding protein DprA/Smf involved in DNA uptake
MSTVEEIQLYIRSQLEAIEGEAAALRNALQAFDANGATRSSAPPKAPGRGRARGRNGSKQLTEVVPAGRLEQLLGAGGAVTTTELAQRANGAPAQVRTLLKELEAAGKVRRTGQRRGTRWSIITDEDRIAERAAELESRRRRGS